VRLPPCTESIFFFSRDDGGNGGPPLPFRSPCLSLELKHALPRRPAGTAFGFSRDIGVPATPLPVFTGRRPAPRNDRGWSLLALSPPPSQGPQGPPFQCFPSPFIGVRRHPPPRMCPHPLGFFLNTTRSRALLDPPPFFLSVRRPFPC